MPVRVHSVCKICGFTGSRPLVGSGVQPVLDSRVPPDTPGIKSADHYLAVAREMCKQAAECVSGTEVKVRDGDPLQYLIWWCPSGITKGLFLIVTSRGTHGELETMFAPHEGKDYFDDQEGEQIN